MVFPRINRDKKEWAFGVFKNSEASTTLAQGALVCLSLSSPDGNKVLQPTTAAFGVFVGFVIDSAGIAAGDYGRVQTYGFGKALVFQSQTTAIVAGYVLKPTDAQQYAISTFAAGDGTNGFLFAAEAVATVTTAAGALKNVWVRAL